jgi:hypothetical protein
MDILPGWGVAAGSFDELKKEVVESIQFYIECALQEGDEYPAVFDGEYELDYRCTVESLLHFYQGIFTKAAFERLTGIKQRQISHYASGLHKPRPAQEEKIKKALRSLGEELIAISV